LRRIQTFALWKAPNPEDHRSFALWVVQESPQVFEDMDFMTRGDDFIAFREGYETGWLDRMIEGVLVRCFPKSVHPKSFHASLQQISGFLTMHRKFSLLPSNSSKPAIRA